MTPELEERFKALLRQHVLFSLLDEGSVDQLAAAADVVAFPFGERVLAEGEPGDCAYLIHNGRARVLKVGEGGKLVTLGMLGPGDLFGEQAVLRNIVRTASVRAAEDLVLFRIRRDDFARLLRDHPDLAEAVEQLIRKRSLMDFLRMQTALQSLPVRVLLTVLERTREQTFPAGETVLEAGEVSHGLYVVRSGEIRVDGSEGSGVLGPGRHFGAVSTLSRRPSPQRFVAGSQTTCLYVDREDLDKLVVGSDALRTLLNPEGGNEALPLTPALTPAAVPPPQGPRQQQLTPPARHGRHPWLPQHDTTDCGAASLAIVARCHGIRLPISRLRELAGTGPNGASLLGLASAGEAVGFHCRAVRTDFGHLAGLDLPAIAHWQNAHYVVVYEANARRVVVGDPAIGVLTCDRAEFEAGWNGRLLLLRPTPRLEEQEPPRNTLQRFLPFLGPHRRTLFEVLLAALLLELMRLATPVITQLVIDRVLVHQNVRLLNVLLVALLLVGVVQTTAAVLRGYLLTHIGQRVGLVLRADLFRRVLTLPLRVFHSRRVGDFLVRFEDSQRLQDLVTGRAVSALLDVLVILSSVSLMVVYSGRLSIVALSALPFYAGLTILFTPRLRCSQRRAFERRSLADSALVEALKGITALKDAGAEQAARWRFEDLIVRQSNAEYEGRRVTLTLEGLFRAVSLLSGALTLWLGARLVLAGELTVGQMVAFSTLTAMAAVPVVGLTSLWFELQTFFLSLERLNDLYSTPSEGLHGENPEEGGPRSWAGTGQSPALPNAGLPGHLPRLPRLQGLVRFENVSFRYRPDEGNILCNVSLEVRPGQTVALIGRSGSGKTTLAMLLQGFYPPTEGRITLDGMDISRVDLRSLRDQVSVVAQESVILTGTIRDNIALADSEMPLDHVVAAAKLANAHDFITAFPLGYDTLVGELGVRLSGGQKQRLAIARALLKDPRVLVLDEATAALDAESERALQESMRAVLRERTVLIIAHRLATVQSADNIVVLDAGQVVEQGTHAQLLDKRGLYHYLVGQQLG
jgi:subfamily B ATP-binding cassette protein HlyB/CyaB